VSVVVAAAAATQLDPVTREWVATATAYARFAGPDGDRVVVEDQWGVGHALLRLAHAHAAQPLTLGDGVWLSADARLDDRIGVRSALTAAGHPAADRADDAELVLRAYAAWGERFLDRISGDFALVLWDTRHQRLLCACDQIGVVPLHYTRLGDRLLVASSPELLLLHPDVSDALDEQAVADFLLTGQAGSFGTTAFAAIKRLPPAHAMQWSDGRLQLRRYWEAPEFEPLLRLAAPAEYGERFRRLLEQAVADRIDPGPLTTHLSGGMDSTSITALAHHVRADGNASDGELRAMTAVLGGESGDREGDYAALVADELGVEVDLLDESTFTSTDPFAAPKLLTPEPSAYQWSDFQYQQIAVAARHARTCLSGLGADPLLGFVPWYWAEWLARGHVRRLATTYLDQARLFGQRPQPHLRSTVRHLTATRRTPDPVVPIWMNREFATSVDAVDRLRRITTPPSWTWDKRSLTRVPVWQTWFTWADPTYTRLPVRVRHPFVDLRLLEFTARIPPYPWLVGKRILRDATDGLLPTEVRRRPKTLLVDSRSARATPEVRQTLAELVASVPAAARFLDTATLREAVLAPDLTIWQHWILGRPVGLVHWLAHWKRPRVPADGATE
jgi:asparagine synthase (glutamine-hydrolysing)